MNQQQDDKGIYREVQKSNSPPPVPEAVAVVVSEPERVQVRAPMDLAGGYVLNVESLNEQECGAWIVRVPEGGVREGELFQGDVISGQTIVSTKDTNPHDIPTGRWRDGICNFCAHGCCHPILCLSFWCLPLALGQVMTRMKLGINGNPATNSNSTMQRNTLSPFKTLLIYFLVYSIVRVNYPFVKIIIEPPTPGNPEKATFRCLPIHLAFFVFIRYLVIKTRLYIRRTYDIPERFCIGCEDCCCAFWCTWCTVSQMARHTAEYRTYQASCCSDTGFNERTPTTVTSTSVNAHVV